MKMRFKFLAMILVAFSLLTLFSCEKTEKETGEESKNDPPAPFTMEEVLYSPSESATNLVCIQMDSGKRIVLELYPEIAPITVANFQKLVDQGFYDGLNFHRVSKGFVIQGGDPKGDGSGGPGWTIKGEFNSNGVKNDLSHERGVLSMARAQSPNSAGSQFFICLSGTTCKQLDGKYASFGRVIAGMDTVDEIAAVRCNGEMPLKAQIMEKVYFVTTD